MGDQRRGDSEHAREQDHDVQSEKRDERERDDDAFDGEHAKAQLAYHEKRTSPDVGSSPVHKVDAVGGRKESDNHYERYKQAKSAQAAKQVVDAVRDMDIGPESGKRGIVGQEIMELAQFLSPRDVLIVAGLCGVDIATTVFAALEAKPPIARATLRAYFADIGYYRLLGAFDASAELAPALHARFSASPIELLPQVGESGILANPSVLKWLLDTTPPKVAARMILESTPAGFFGPKLDKLGDAGWQWLDAVDSKLAAIAPEALEQYRNYAEEKGRHVSRADGPAAKVNAGTLKAQRGQVIAKSSPLDLQQDMQLAGMSAAEQLEWILDKPNVTPAQVREATAVMETTTMQLTPALVAKLQRQFPKGAVEDLFSGEVPLGLVKLGAKDTRIASWLLRAAEPETILRIVTAAPDLIDEWCAMLVATGVGYGWVRELGGQTNDRWLRRFVLKCPDEPTRRYIQDRILGHGVDVGSRTDAVAAPTAYTSAASHLDADLARTEGSRPTNQEVIDRRATTIAADVEDLDDKEIEVLRRDPSRLRQVFATATPRTFVQILDHVQPDLQVAVSFATKQNVSASHLTSWAQSRPIRELVATMSSPTLVDRLLNIVGQSLGPLELFPALVSPPIVGQILERNPAFLDWLMMSEPTIVVRAISTTAVLDVAVRGLAKHTALIEQTWPSAAALGPQGRSILVQLAARAKGALHDVLEAKLKEQLPPAPKAGDEESETVESRDQAALLLREGGDLTTQLNELLNEKTENETLLIALCRGTVGAAKMVSGNPTLAARLMDKLQVAPEVVFDETLSALLAMPGLHGWLLSKTAATALLAGITDANAPSVAKSLDDSEHAESFIKGLPRGRALTPTQKKTLHKLSLLTSERMQRSLFAVTFDTPVTKLSRAEVEKTWSVLERLPEAHVDQKSIAAFVGTDGGIDNGTLGVYYPENKDIKLQQGHVDKKTTGGVYDTGVSMTEDQAIEALGSRDDLARFVAENRLVRNPDNTYSFIPPQEIEVFPQTILHEVGHAVDYMLGARTDFIYEIAGWKQFSISDFDGWARELGGWDQVTADDQRQIRALWVSWLNGGTDASVAGMADRDHPINARQYMSVGAVRLAHESNPSLATLVGRGAGMARSSDQAFYSMSQKAYNAAPSAYALTAPAEYFAECYANYYRDFDGTQKTAQNKGASLAPWIKRWFDANVDRAGHNPQR